MKTQFIYCLPLYIFILICLFLLFKALYPLVVLFFKGLNFRRIFKYTLTGYFILSVVYVIITSFN